MKEPYLKRNIVTHASGTIPYHIKRGCMPHKLPMGHSQKTILRPIMITQSNKAQQ